MQTPPPATTSVLTCRRVGVTVDAVTDPQHSSTDTSLRLDDLERDAKVPRRSTGPIAGFADLVNEPRRLRSHLMHRPSRGGKR